VAPVGKRRNAYRDLVGETDKNSFLKTEASMGV